MNYWIGSLIVTVLILATLSWIVYSRNRHRPLNRRFMVFNLALVMWSCTAILLMSLNDIVHLLFLLKLISVIGAFLPAAFMYFVAGFEITPDGKEPESLKRMQVVCFVFAVIASLFVIYPSFIKKIIINAETTNNLPGPEVIYGFPFIPYTSIIILSMVFGFWHLYRIMRKRKGAQKTEIQYIFLATIAGTVFAVLTALVAPLLGTTVPCRFSPLSSIIMASIIAYAIAKHRIMNISVIAEKVFIYACLSVSLIFVYIFSLLFFINLMKLFTQKESSLPVVISAFIIAMIFSPMKEIIGRWAKTRIFRQQYEIDSVLFQMRLITGSALTLEEGIMAMLEILKNEINLTGRSNFMLNLRDESLRKIFSILKTSPISVFELEEDSPLFRMIESRPHVHFRDELFRFSTRTIIGAAIKEMDIYEADVAIPVIIHNRFSGILLLGGKEGQMNFTERDRRILHAFSIYLGVFIESNQLLNTLRENRIYQQSLLENLPEGVIAVDNSGRVIVFNYMAEKVTGLRKIDVIERDYETVLPEPIRQNLSELLKHDTETKNTELELARNGKMIPLRASGSRFFSFDGSLLGAQLIFSDVSHLKSLQRQIERNERLASLGILAGGIAHEIRNPLVALKTFSQLLPERFQDQEFRANYIRVVIPEIERINHLVEQLLAFARPGSPRMEEADLVSIVQSTTMLLSAQEKFKNIRILINSNLAVIRIMVDPEKIKQALLNILLNSAESIENKSGEIQISIRKETDRIVLEIQDNGYGIKPDILGKIFDPLFTTKPHGTGLGLTIVNEIIAQHNGRINIESKYGHGTKVLIELPVRQGVFQ